MLRAFAHGSFGGAIASYCLAFYGLFTSQPAGTAVAGIWGSVWLALGVIAWKMSEEP